MLEIDLRQDLYGFFSRVFSYPDQALLETLVKDMTLVANSLSAGSQQLLSVPSLRELEVSYTELFISRLGGVPVPPYGSVYLEDERQLMGQTSLCVQRAYEDEGLSHPEGGEPPDFIATELEFLYYLVGREIDALVQEDLNAARIAHQRQVDFCHTLLQPWIKKFCLRILQAADAAPLYRWSAEMLMLFCCLEEELYGAS